MIAIDIFNLYLFRMHLVHSGTLLAKWETLLTYVFKIPAKWELLKQIIVEIPVLASFFALSVAPDISKEHNKYYNDFTIFLFCHHNCPRTLAVV